jgi:lipopolysaccharide/colanic/teichoic acid biosynthesis glycosyltransferase
MSLDRTALDRTELHAGACGPSAPVSRGSVETWQRPAAACLLVVASPLLAAIAVAVRLTSPGPSLYRARRVSAGGTFELLKFRTMRAGSDREGPGVTASGDPRVTRLGRLLRDAKLDELPQLWNVVRGEMLIVGPRPEDPRYVDWDDPLHRAVFSAKPGIVGPTALAYRHEEPILAAAAREVAMAAGRSTPTPGDVDRAYRERLLPAKLAIDGGYLASRSVRGDLAILGRTLGVISRRHPGGAPHP